MIRTLSFAALVMAVATNAHAQDASVVPLGDEYFAMKAYSEGLAEVAKSQLAAERASEPGVKNFAEKMVKDHTECNQKIAQLASSKGIPLPRTIDAVHSAAINRLAKLSGSEFDKAYLMAQVGAHKNAIHLFGHESRKGEDDELKGLASKTLPDLWAHAKMAFDLSGEKREYEKFYKVMEYAKQVMDEK